MEQPDVRMRGFARRARVEEAVAWVDEQAMALPAEETPLDALCGRVLAANVAAPCDVPEFARAAMDGYAVRGEETLGAAPYTPLTLRLVGESLPARPFAGDLLPGTAVRIMTGAPLPSGADAVLPAEFAQEHAGSVELQAAVPPGKHVGQRGEDVRQGQIVLNRGRRLRPQDAAMLAALGLVSAPVIRAPRVRILATGSEIVPPGQPRGSYQIHDSNSTLLAALVRRDGGVLESAALLGDDPDALRKALCAPGADVILVSGGSSVGAEDHAPRLVRTCGELAVHGVAMRPSSPAGMGRIRRAADGSSSTEGPLVFLLPGNPVSCLCAYDFFAGRAIRRLAGGSGEWPYRAETVALERKVASAVGRVDYVRMRLTESGRAEPLSLGGAAILSSTVRADGFLVVPEALEGYPPGAAVTLWRY